MNDSTVTPQVILVPGHWLGGWAWEQVEGLLTADGHACQAVTLPGLDPADGARSDRTLSEQADMLTDLVERTARDAAGPIVVVAHSGANAPATLVLDRRPDLVDLVIWVDSGPVADGSVFADVDESVREVPLPPFAELGQQASLEGLDQDALDRFRDRSVPEPAAVMREPVHLSNERRRDVPAVVVCCSYTGEQVMEKARSGDPMLAETATLRQVTTVDLPTGHWPMWSRPADLAQVIMTAIAERAKG